MGCGGRAGERKDQSPSETILSQHFFFRFVASKHSKQACQTHRNVCVCVCIAIRLVSGETGSNRIRQIILCSGCRDGLAAFHQANDYISKEDGLIEPKNEIKYQKYFMSLRNSLLYGHMDETTPN